jgi:hypothetical protein
MDRFPIGLGELNKDKDKEVARQGGASPTLASIGTLGGAQYFIVVRTIGREAFRSLLLTRIRMGL